MVSTRLLDSLLEPVHVSESDRRNPLGLSFSVAPAFCLQIPLRLNKPTETQYFYTDGDTTGASLDGKNTYEITFGPGQEPPVNGFWSLTLYNAQHFLAITGGCAGRSGARPPCLGFGDRRRQYDGRASPGRPAQRKV